MGNVFWPYSTRAALGLGIAIWLAAGLVLLLTNAVIGWPDEQTSGWLPYVVLLFGLAPLALVLLDGFRSSRAKVDLRWVKIDFSAATVIRETAGLPDNVVAPGESVIDSAGHIRAALEKAGDSQILVVDLKDGDAWWVTRLLVLASGAVQRGFTEAIVFVGTREETQTRTFLGWSTPEAVLRSILRDRQTYAERFDRAARIERQLEVFGPAAPTSKGLDPAVQRFAAYGTPPREHILLELMAAPVPPDEPLENPPDRVTETRLEHLFAHCLHRNDVIDLTDSSEEQMRVLLSGQAPFVPVARAGRFQGLLRRTDGERFVLRELFEQSTNGVAGAGRVATS
jgi:hypothetical protein